MPWFASSPDVIAVIDLSKVDATEETGEVIAVVEFKTGVGASTAARYIRTACADVRCCEFGDTVCELLVPQEFMAQILMQLYTTSTSYAMFISASESCICFAVILKFPDHIQTLVKTVMLNISESVSWAHAETYQDAQRRIPEGIALSERKIVESNLVFWHQVNARVTSVGPFPPLKLFKNAVQTFYSKTKPGVDGLTQATASASCKWEQIIATKGLQTCAHNTQAWRSSYTQEKTM